MRLDALLAQPQVQWLVSEVEKIAYLRSLLPDFPIERLPHVGSRTGVRPRFRLFPSDVLVGIGESRPTFAYVVTTADEEDWGRVITRHGELLAALPFIGALGAWLSLRAGGNTRDGLLTALGSAWLNGAILTLGVPLSMIIERHFSLSIKLTAYIVYMIAWCLVPAVLLALGALPWLGRKATMRARGATGL